MSRWVGAAHRLGLNETAKAMAIVWSPGGFWSFYVEGVSSAAGACGSSTWSDRAWHSLIFRYLCAGQRPCRWRWTHHTHPGGAGLLSGIHARCASLLYEVSS